MLSKLQYSWFNEIASATEPILVSSSRAFSKGGDEGMTPHKDGYKCCFTWQT